MDTITPTDSLKRSAVEDDPFFELVHSDPLLLRAEFDDLTNASRSDVPPTDRAPTDRAAGGGSRRANRDESKVSSIADERQRSRALRTGQRSPPHRR